MPRRVKCGQLESSQPNFGQVGLSRVKWVKWTKCVQLGACAVDYLYWPSATYLEEVKHYLLFTVMLQV